MMPGTAECQKGGFRPGRPLPTGAKKSLLDAARAVLAYIQAAGIEEDREGDADYFSDVALGSRLGRDESQNEKAQQERQQE